MINQPTGCGNDNVWLFGKDDLLCDHVDTTNDDGALGTNACSEGVKLLANLDCQLACRRHDYSKQALWFCQESLLFEGTTSEYERTCYFGGGGGRLWLVVVTCRMGMANAAVLPEPVSARPMTSRPAKATGSDSA